MPDAPQHFWTARRQRLPLEHGDLRRRHPFEFNAFESRRAIDILRVDPNHVGRLVEPRRSDRDQPPLGTMFELKNQIERLIRDGGKEESVERSDALVPSVQDVDARQRPTCGAKVRRLRISKCAVNRLPASERCVILHDPVLLGTKRHLP
jgi:hypothetical protein